MPQRCTLLFTGTKKFGGKTYTKTCEYKGTVLQPALKLCRFGKDVLEVSTVKVEVVKSLKIPTTMVLYLDDVKHRNYP